jgi:hypothetical protein
MSEHELIAKALESGLAEILGKLQGPPKSRLWSMEDFACYLDISVRILSDLKKSPSFPVPRMIHKTPKWIPEEVIKWADLQKKSRPGQQRKSAPRI